MYVRSAITPFGTALKAAPQIDRNRMRLAEWSNTGEKSILQALKPLAKNSKKKCTLTNGVRNRILVKKNDLIFHGPLPFNIAVYYIYRYFQNSTHQFIVWTRRVRQVRLSLQVPRKEACILWCLNIDSLLNL